MELNVHKTNALILLGNVRVLSTKQLLAAANIVTETGPTDASKC